MPRHAQPVEIAQLKGATHKHPERYKTEVPKNENPIGGAPSFFSPDEIIAWDQLIEHSLPGVLTAADRFMVELGAKLLAESRREGEDFTGAKVAQLVSILGRLGLSPADRQKVAGPQQKGGNPFDGF